MCLACTLPICSHVGWGLCTCNVGGLQLRSPHAYTVCPLHEMGIILIQAGAGATAAALLPHCPHSNAAASSEPLAGGLLGGQCRPYMA